MEKNGSRRKFQLNTKNCCLFCLQEVGERASCSNISVLLKHLGINVSDVVTGEFGNSEMGVQLCEECEGFNRKAMGQIRFVEVLQRSLGRSLSSIREVILKTNGNHGRIGEYEKWVGPDSDAILDEDTVCVQYLRERLRTECFRLTAKVKLEGEGVLDTSLPQASSDGKEKKDSSSVDEKKLTGGEVTCSKSSVTRRGSGPKKRKCSVCAERLNSFSHLKSHREQVHSLDTYRCDICEKIFHENVALKIHRRDAHNIPILADSDSYRCEKVGCGKMFRTKAHLNFHNQLCQPNKIEAESTDSGNPLADCVDGSSQSFLDNQKKSSVDITSTSLMRKKQGESRVKDSTASISMMDTVNGSEVEVTGCTPGTCSSTQPHNVDVKLDVKSDLECPNCHEVFSYESKNVYEDHIQNCSGLPEEKPSLIGEFPILERPSCSKALSSLKGNPSQRKASLKVKKSTPSQQTTRKTLVKEESQGKSPCPHCRKCFTKSTLKNHVKHCNDKGHKWVPHKCTILGCSHIFASQAELNKHLQTHPASLTQAIPENLGEPEPTKSTSYIYGVFVCGHCKGEFQTERLLHDHKKKEHKKSCFQNCPFCYK